MALTQSNNQAGFHDAELDLYHNILAFIKSMVLKSAMDLRIADAIHHHGGAATLAQIATKVTLHPSKISCLRRLLRVLVVSGVLTFKHPAPGISDEPVYMLTSTSRLLVGTEKQDSIFFTTLLHPIFVTPFLRIGKWLQHEQLDQSTLFEQTHGQSLWEIGEKDEALNDLINDGMESDSRVVMDVVVKEHGEVFQGISSLVDVGGGFGAAAKAISKAFPDVKCSVLDLGHVVAKANNGGTDVDYIAGNMFDGIPAANVVLLKSILHGWGDEDCVKILKNCKKAIPSRDVGGKVIIIDIVVGAGPSDQKLKEVQALLDVYLMFINGMERDEQEWKKLFLEAGFSDFKIMPVLGFRSIIEVYP